MDGLGLLILLGIDAPLRKGVSTSSAAVDEAVEDKLQARLDARSTGQLAEGARLP